MNGINVPLADRQVRLSRLYLLSPPKGVPREHTQLPTHGAQAGCYAQHCKGVARGLAAKVQHMEAAQTRRDGDVGR